MNPPTWSDPDCPIIAFLYSTKGTRLNMGQPPLQNLVNLHRTVADALVLVVIVRPLSLSLSLSLSL
eukprot:6024461-Amphidinium_carterae.1